MTQTGSDTTRASFDLDKRWDQSALPRDILGVLDQPHTLDEIAEDLDVTDARVLWYLQKLHASGRVSRSDDAWIRTEAGRHLLDTPSVESPDHTIMPGRTVYDFRQAFADTAAGMFGEDYVQVGGEHGGRLSCEQAEEFKDRLISLVAEYFGPGQGDRSGTKYGFHWVLTPTDLHPLGDDSPRPE